MQVGWVQLDEPVDVPDLDGLSAALDTGSLPAVVNIWATWCGPCREEMPLLQAASKDGRISVVGVSMDTDPGTSADFMRRVGADYPNLPDGEGDLVSSLAKEFPVRGYPISLAVANDQIFAVHVGAFDNVGQIGRVRELVGG